MGKYTKLLLKYIPGGAHTYSRGADTFPINAPEILLKGKGVRIYDLKNKELIDYGMGLRSVNIGYAEPAIDRAAFFGIKSGNNLTRPSSIELKAAKLFTSIIKSAEMVKFGKNGSVSVTAAIKLARAYTGKKIILRCYNHPFFSFDDWFIGSTIINRGIPQEIKSLTDVFYYNNIESLKKKIKQYKNNIACVVIEPAADECPKIDQEIYCCGLEKCNRNYKNKNHFLKEVQTLCNDNKIVFVLDEMITGFRWDFGGAQNFFNIDPDLSTFGKAMGNGFSVSAVCGKRNIMELGSIVNKQERVFLLSTTHGAEMGPLNAFCETVKFIKENNVIKKNWKYGSLLMNGMNTISKDHGVNENFYVKGPACSPSFFTLDSKKNNNLAFRTLFLQEMIKNGVLMPWISIAYRHNAGILKKTLSAVDKSLYIYKKALKLGVNRYLKGRPIKPVFRRYN